MTKSKIASVMVAGTKTDSCSSTALIIKLCVSFPSNLSFYGELFLIYAIIIMKLNLNYNYTLIYTYSLIYGNKATILIPTKLRTTRYD